MLEKIVQGIRAKFDVYPHSLFVREGLNFVQIQSQDDLKMLLPDQPTPYHFFFK